MIDVTLKRKEGFIPKQISADQAKDTGMAMVLICLLIGLIGGRPLFFKLSISLLLINMIWPSFYKPVAKLWLGLSHLLGTVMSKVLLSILFFVMVTPVAAIRRVGGADSLQLKKWKKGRCSVFRVRDHKFKLEDINKPY
jgi:hypothetical protein